MQTVDPLAGRVDVRPPVLEELIAHMSVVGSSPAAERWLFGRDVELPERQKARSALAADEGAAAFSAPLGTVAASQDKTHLARAIVERIVDVCDAGRLASLRLLFFVLTSTR